MNYIHLLKLQFIKNILFVIFNLIYLDIKNKVKIFSLQLFI
jgi:hypothetical protein